MPKREKRLFFLLGAGASKPAGIPLVKEFVNEFKSDFDNQAGTNSAIFSMLTGLIPLHFDDCLPFSMFTIADINKINLCLEDKKGLV